MNNEFLTFQRFTDLAIAEAIAEKLREQQIDTRIEKEAQLLDPVWIGTSSLPDIILKIHPADFVNAHSVIGEFYRQAIETADPSYYLFGYSNTELEEIVSMAEEWGPYDYQLAKKILRTRGEAIPEEKSSRFSAEKLVALSKPLNGTGLITIGILFILYVLISTLFMHLNRQFNFPYSIFLILLAGSHLAKGKKTLPNGTQVFLFIENDRKAGRVINVIGIIFLVYLFVSILLADTGYSFGLFDFSF